MDKIRCPICSNEPDKFFNKGVVLYSQCANCKTVFCDMLDQEGKIGGEYEVERNEKENYLRIERVDQMAYGIPKHEVRILDWGCGSGYFIDDLKKAGYMHVDGFDAYNEKFITLPKKEHYHIVTATEVFEHFSSPFREIDVIYRSLVNGGGVIIETSFTNIAEQEKIPIEDFFYISPEAGHSTLFSHHSLDLLMALKSFRPLQHYNRHCRAYVKR